MPPKKPRIYLADYADVESFVRRYMDLVDKVLGTNYTAWEEYDPFHMLPDEFFRSARSYTAPVPAIRVLRLLFRVLDVDCGPSDKDPPSRVARNGIETALLDAWARLCNVSLCELAGISPTYKPSFCTVGLFDTFDETIASTRFGLDHTPYLKVKLNRDVVRGAAIIEHICNFIENNADPSELLHHRKEHYRLSLDANCDWTPRIALEYLEKVVLPRRHRIVMVEQPFPVDLAESERSLWGDVARRYHDAGVPIYADESVATAADVEAVADIAHGVNLKIDKAGGLREAMRAVATARRHGLGVWVGTMVAGVVSSSAAATLLPLADCGGDLDGPLLVEPASMGFQGGYVWDTKEGLAAPPAGGGAAGLNVEKL